MMTLSSLGDTGTGGARVGGGTRASRMVEATGPNGKGGGVERLIRPFGLIEMARTGEIAIARGRTET